MAVLAKKLTDESAAYELLEDMRRPDGPVCPHCESVNRAYFLKPRDGVRRTQTGKVSHRRLWKCAERRKQFSVLVGTIFEKSQVPLSKWLMALYMMSANKNGVAAYEVHRTLGVTNKTVWFMLHRIREAMKRGAVVESMQGTVVADETFIGGSDRNRHKKDRHPGITVAAEPERVVPGRREKRSTGPYRNKTAVLSLINRETGEARSRIISDVTGATLRKAITEQVNMASTELHTDEHRSYRILRPELAGHKTVNHSADEYVRYEAEGVVTTNQAENFFSQLKRSIDGTHHHVSTEHLSRYLVEFDSVTALAR